MIIKATDPNAQEILASLRRAPTHHFLINLVANYMSPFLLLFVLGISFIRGTLNDLVLWLTIYAVYAAGVTVWLLTHRESFETQRARLLRIAAMIGFSIWLIAITGGAGSSFWFLLLWPSLATTLYVPERRLSYPIYGMIAVAYASIAFLSTPNIFQDHLEDFAINASLLGALSIAFRILLRNLRLRLNHIANLLATNRTLSQSIKSYKTLRDALSKIAKAALQTLEADIVTIYLYDQENNRVERSERSPIIAGEIRQQVPIKQINEDSVIYEIANSRKPIYQNDVRKEPLFSTTWHDDPNIDNRFVKRENIISVAGLPLIRDEKVLGVMFINYRQPRNFDIDIELKTGCEIFALQAATAIENAQLFDAQRKAHQAMKSLHQVITEHNLEEAMLRVVEGVNNYLGKGVSSTLILRDLDKDTFSAFVAHGPKKETIYTNPRNDGTTMYVLKTEKPLYLEDVHNPPEDAPTIRRNSIYAGIQSYAALPLYSRTEKHGIIGVIAINSERAMNFTKETRDFLTQFVDQAAIALENTRLYEQLLHANKRITLINTFGNVLAANNEQ